MSNQPKILNCEVVENRPVAESVFRMRLRGEHIASNVLPGQFVNVQTSDSYLPLLRRPFSVARVYPAESQFDLIGKEVGPGTRLMSQVRPGERLNLVGPLGNSFDVGKPGHRAVLVAGGVGIAPLIPLAQQLKSVTDRVLLCFGARTVSEVIPVEELDCPIQITTEDGTAGTRGVVTELVSRELETGLPGEIRVYGCGPNGLLRALSSLAREFDVDVQISLETMMGCGFGACAGCPVERVGEASTSGMARYPLVCRDGPVFSAREVVLHD